MSIVVFLGPTLAAASASKLLPAATIRGPAVCGDVYLAVREGFRAIAIVDGYFEHQPSVWHKELLWAIQSGVRVYGAASMGALRAAELEAFGMIGVGRIFEQYRNGELTDDDEVAVAHEDATRGYRAVSEAMVNIRATLALAASEGALGEADSQQLVDLAKNLFYCERSYAELRRRTNEHDFSAERLAAFWSWLDRTGGVSQKRDDANALLERILEDQRAPCAASAPSFEFEYTDAWHAFRQTMDARIDTRTAPGEEDVPSAAALRALAVQVARAEGAFPTADQVQAHSEVLRRRLGLLSPEATSDWLAKHQLDLQTFSLIVYEDWLAEQYREKAVALASAQRPVVAVLSDPMGRGR